MTDTPLRERIARWCEQDKGREDEDAIDLLVEAAETVSQLEHRVAELEEFARWASRFEEPYTDDGWECSRCGASVHLLPEKEVPEHGCCHGCCSDIVEEMYAKARALTPGPDTGGNK